MAVSSAEAQLILKAVEIGIALLERIPQRTGDQEASLQRIKGMIERGELPDVSEFDIVLAQIATLSSERDEIIANKPE